MSRNYKKKENEEQVYERKEGMPHKDWDLNYKASKWFVNKYLESFAPYISFELMEDENLEVPYLGYRFNYQDKDTKFFTIIDFHKDYEQCKKELCSMCRTIMRKKGMKDAFNIKNWNDFVKCSVIYINHIEKEKEHTTYQPYKD